MLAGTESEVVAETAHERLVRGELAGGFAANGFADAARQHAEVIAAGRDDPWNQFVLQREQLVRIELAVVGVRPQVRAGDRIDELRGDTNRGAGLTDAAFQNVARTHRLADRADVARSA